ncbi:hypothetical protein CANARDRAFT_27144 [[Candida] arabinofermentans NRRL YB-2248]|uniref:Major facilitator superfamily (MFS) profile domain-containing protein n=1 Tax=[Candida] arabinofermentans NRRL YB-2248 TaxID=983967 RepID=A0A1E4T4T9_9ASCO|nr:hypothetical protein CANARDRAFT_27144 [[Candida] arabinofermentans NRRL YB-2248]
MSGTEDSSDLISLDSGVESISNSLNLGPQQIRSPLNAAQKTSRSNSVLSRMLTETSVNSTQTISRLNSISQTVSKNLKEIVLQVKDDNLQTNLENAELRRTRVGRVRTNLDLSDAIKIATNKSLQPPSSNLEPEKLTSEEGQSENENIESAILEDTEDDNLPPVDTGYAWVVVVAEFLLLFSTWGCNGSYGVFLSYWSNNKTFKGATSVDYALVGSLVLSLAQGLAPVIQVASAIFGMKEVMCLGIVLQNGGYLLSSFATKTWQLYLTSGLLVGLGFACLFNPAIVVLTEWFDKKRGLASGIVVSASGVGGVVFALSSQRLIKTTGSYRWALRMIAIIACVLNIILTIIIKPRVPKPKLKSWHEIKTRVNILFDMRVLKQPQVHLIALWFTLVVTCYVMALFTLSSYCLFIGLSQDQGSHITAIFNGCQAIGRCMIGLSADYVGRVNLSFFLTFVMVVLLFAMWINASTFIVILFYAILSGLTFGVASTLNQPVMADAVIPELFPSAWSYENLMVGCFCLFAEVATLKLRDLKASMPFLKPQVFSGSFGAGGFIFVSVLREWKIKKIIQSRLEKTEDELAKANAGDDSQIERELLYSRRNAYNLLLKGGLVGYFKRLFYPIKV